jgi:hypothetical protein
MFLFGFIYIHKYFLFLKILAQNIVNIKIALN